MSQIHELLPLVMADVGNIPKARKSQAAGNYRFRGIDDVLNAVQPILIKHSVSVAFKCEDAKTETFTQKEKLVYRVTLLMNVTFSAPDGSSVTNTAAGEGQDFGGDKATNKAMSAAFKYAMFFGLCIPIDSDDAEDSDAGKPVIRQADTAPAKPKLPDFATAPESISPVALVQPSTIQHPDTGVSSRRTDGKCYPDQIEKLIAAAEFAEMPREALIAAIQKRGASKAAELSFAQIEELIAKLQQVGAEKNPPF